MTAEARLLVLERVVGDARATDAHMGLFWGRKSTAAFPLQKPASSHEYRSGRLRASG